MTLIRTALASCVATALTLLAAAPASAAVDISIYEDGTDVVATFSGTVNMTGLTQVIQGATAYGFVHGAVGQIKFGTENYKVYSGISAGVTNFGTGLRTQATTNIGDTFVIRGDTARLWLANNYVSGDAMSGSNTWANSSLSSLGLNPGTYTWTWGSGLNLDSATLTISAAPVPEPEAYALMLAGLGVLGALGRRQKNRAAGSATTA